MAARVFKLDEGSEQHNFFECRDMIAGFTGGYGNGKTAALGVLGINLGMSYENARILVGRATRPKLEDSTKPELLKWLPEDWVTSWPSERKNNIKLITGSTIEFRHVRQEGKGKGEEQSNLLSATYDGILVDQMDDPEFTYKDFADLVGRLRGTARYIGSDASMPKAGPQWLRFTANPTRNWLFREVVNPYFIFKRTGVVTQKLLRIDQEPIVRVFNAPTAANSKNTGSDYAARMNAVFRGDMGKRFIEGSWDAYQGLVYPEYDETVHVVHEDAVHAFVLEGIRDDVLGVVEAYDYGKTSPSCYLLAFVTSVGDVILVDGFYSPDVTIAQQAVMIQQIRKNWNVIPTEPIFADPDIFRGKQASVKKVGESIARMFDECGVSMQRGNNDIAGGIAKVSSYLVSDALHMHPIARRYGAPRLFFSSRLEYLHNEIVDYYWNKNMAGQNVDKPRDGNDHAMDALKYLLTRRPKVIGSISATRDRRLNPALFAWQEHDKSQNKELLPRHR